MWRITKPFVNITSGGIARPCLDITIANPHTGLKTKTLGLIDTGADECAMPASYAKMLGHILEKGKSRKIMTGNGPTVSYFHTIDIEIDGLIIKNILIDFMPNLHIPLLGVKSFLGKFILTVNYPKKTFTLLKK